MSHDVIVIGAGMAGMTAGLRLAQEGLDVLVVSAGQGCLALAPGVVDVLGYTPQLVEAPARQLPAFIEDHPEHPYANLSVSELGESLDWFKEVAAPLGYSGSLEHNQLMPTGLGALRPTALVPETMAAGNLVAGGSVLVVGLTGYRDFYPNLIADNLSATALPQGAKISARAVEVGLSGDPRDLRPQLLVRRLEQRPVRSALGRAIRAELTQEEEVVAVPAVLGLEHSHEVWSDLEQMVGRPVCEISTLPPSQPGLRLFGVLTKALRRSGGRLQIGTTVVGAKTGGGRVESVLVAQASRQAQLEAGQFVLATGGIATGGITVNPSGAAREAVFDLPVSGLPTPGGVPAPEYFTSHLFDRVGLRTDRELRPIDGDGSPIYPNLRVAGAALAGAAPWREKSGDGISLATGFKAAMAILEERG
jgi:glycerol-3-phosphate dehydrogenase subunit B